MEKQILLDALSMVDERPKGAQIYIFNLLKQFSIIDNDFEFTVLINKNKDIFKLPQSHKIHYEKIKIEHSSLWQLLKLSNYLKKTNFKLLHLMTEGTVLADISIPYIMTIHESLKKYYKYSANINIFDIKKKILKIASLGLRHKMIRKANNLIAISENTKKDLISEYRIDGNKIKVIYEAVDEMFFHDRDKVYNIPYILIFATGDRRENITCELQAFSKIKDEIDHYLFIVGLPKGRFQEEIKKRCQKLGILDKTKFFGFVSDDKLASLYKNSDIYVDISFLEGFGLQVMEAMASGIPIIASNIDSIPEIVGEAGILIDYNNDNALASSILSVLKDNKKKEKMSIASRKQAEKFSWEKTAKETLRLYEEILCQKSL